MEICSNAGSFVRSDASSWSKNIHLERLVRKKTRYDKPNEILISDDWTPDYWHPINEHILESLAKEMGLLFSPNLLNDISIYLWLFLLFFDSFVDTNNSI